MVDRRGCLACGPQTLERAGYGNGREDRDRPAAIGHLDRLAGLDPAKELARALSSSRIPILAMCYR